MHANSCAFTRLAVSRQRCSAEDSAALLAPLCYPLPWTAAQPLRNHSDEPNNAPCSRRHLRRCCGTPAYDRRTCTPVAMPSHSHNSRSTRLPQIRGEVAELEYGTVRLRAVQVRNCTGAGTKLYYAGTKLYYAGYNFVSGYPFFLDSARSDLRRVEFVCLRYLVWLLPPRRGGTRRPPYLRRKYGGTRARATVADFGSFRVRGTGTRYVSAAGMRYARSS